MLTFIFWYFNVLLWEGQEVAYMLRNIEEKKIKDTLLCLGSSMFIAIDLILLEKC